MPIYILSRHPAPAWAADWPLVCYGNDPDAAIRDAKQAAGDKNVLIHGASTAQRALNTGLLDELEIHLIPVLLGDGRRLLDHLGAGRRELERVGVLEGEGWRHPPSLPHPPLTVQGGDLHRHERGDAPRSGGVNLLQPESKENSQWAES